MVGGLSLFETSLYLKQLHSSVSPFFFILHAQKHKERDRHKPKHKKTMDMSPSLVLPNIMVPDKVRALLCFGELWLGRLNITAGVAGWLFFLTLINLCCSPSLSLTHPDIPLTFLPFLVFPFSTGIILIIIFLCSGASPWFLSSLSVRP